jgi:hypothetical protein
MNVLGFKKLLFCLWICLVTVPAGTVLLFNGAIAAGGPEPAPPGEAAPEAAKEIRPKVGFVLQKVGDRWAPEPCYYEPFRLPGTHIRFGSFRYLIPEDEELGAPMFGFLRDDGKFFYFRETAASDSDLQYALSGSYFVVDGGAGGSGICRSMYLFRYDEDSMRLLDKIEEPPGGDFSPLGFASDYPGKPAYGHELGTGHDDVPVWLVSEKDRQRHPLIRLRMARDFPPPFLGPQEFETFHIYLKMVNGRLRVALDPDLYVTIFNSLGEAGRPYSRSAEYYVSGFLAGKLSLATIRAELVNNRDRLWLVNSLRHVKRWDAALHHRLSEAFPKIREYNLNGR